MVLCERFSMFIFHRKLLHCLAMALFRCSCYFFICVFFFFTMGTRESEGESERDRRESVETTWLAKRMWTVLVFFFFLLCVYCVYSIPIFALGKRIFANEKWSTERHHGRRKIENFNIKVNNRKRVLNGNGLYSRQVRSICYNFIVIKFFLVFRPFVPRVHLITGSILAFPFCACIRFG